MKDLFVQAADMDAKMFLSSILEKHDALEIRPISYDIETYPLHDSGMITTGTDLSRMRKGRYEKIILIWDHEGSGRERKQASSEVEREMAAKLDSITWRGNNSTIALVPELESWLWHCQSAIVRHYGIDAARLDALSEEAADRMGMALAVAKTERPKELFEALVKRGIHRTISPRDFQLIGHYAGIKGLLESASFAMLRDILQCWFPKTCECEENHEDR
jgi:hypothetical protein